MKSGDKELQENSSNSGKWIGIPPIMCSISGSCVDTSTVPFDPDHYSLYLYGFLVDMNDTVKKVLQVYELSSTDTLGNLGADFEISGYVQCLTLKNFILQNSSEQSSSWPD